MQSPRSQPSSSLRIIGGDWRRRRLNFIEAPGLRPTSDRLRETLFNWLMLDIREARVLDLFAGTGALGLEALSRGASFVQFIENNVVSAKQLRQNLAVLNADAPRFAVSTSDALQWLQALPPKQDTTAAFDIVFVDPPFDADLWQASFAHLHQSGALHERSLIYVESPKETKLLLPEDWQPYKCTEGGQVRAQLISVFQ